MYIHASKMYTHQSLSETLSPQVARSHISNSSLFFLGLFIYTSRNSFPSSNKTAAINIVPALSLRLRSFASVADLADCHVDCAVLLSKQKQYVAHPQPPTTCPSDSRSLTSNDGADLRSAQHEVSSSVSDLADFMTSTLRPGPHLGKLRLSTRHARDREQQSATHRDVRTHVTLTFPNAGSAPSLCIPGVLDSVRSNASLQAESPRADHTTDALQLQTQPPKSPLNRSSVDEDREVQRPNLQFYALTASSSGLEGGQSASASDSQQEELSLFAFR